MSNKSHILFSLLHHYNCSQTCVPFSSVLWFLCYPQRCCVLLDQATSSSYIFLLEIACCCSPLWWMGTGGEDWLSGTEMRDHQLCYSLYKLTLCSFDQTGYVLTYSCSFRVLWCFFNCIYNHVTWRLSQTFLSIHFNYISLLYPDFQTLF